MAQLTQAEKEAMARRHWKLVPHTIKQFYQHHYNHDDLMENGIMGLSNALEKFDPEKNTKFSTFACTCIKNEVLAYFKKEKKHIERNQSLNHVLTTDKNGHALEVEDTIAHDEENRPLQADELLIEGELRDYIQNSLDVLTEKQRLVIILRYGLNGDMPKTQIDVANEINMSQANVSKLEHDALNRLKYALRRCRKDD